MNNRPPAVVHVAEAVVRVKSRGRRSEAAHEEFMRDPAGVPGGADVRLAFRYSPRFYAHLLALLGHAGTGRVGRVLVRGPEGRTTPCGPLELLTAKAALRPQYLVDHPAAFLARFAPAGDPAALAAVVARVFDPRWFTHPTRPDRMSRPEALFRLLPQYDRTRLDHPYRRLLLQAWGGHTVAWEAPAAAGIAETDYYRRRALRELAVGGPARAVRVVGRHFLRALWAVWGDARTLTRGVNLVEPMFVPGRLFDETSVAAVTGGGPE